MTRLILALVASFIVLGGFASATSASPLIVSQVEGPPVIAGPTNPNTIDNINMVLDIAHTPAIESSQLSTFMSTLNDTFGDATVLKEGQTISYSTLRVGGQMANILVVVAPTKEYSTSEITAIEEHLLKGNSLLLLGAKNTSTFEVMKAFSPISGFYFENTTEEGISILTDLHEPGMPITKEITQILAPGGVTLTANSTLSSDIREVYPIVGSSTYTLVMATELTRQARIIGVSTVDALNNSFYAPLDDSVSRITTVVENELFFRQVLEWLGGFSGHLRVSDASTDMVGALFLPGPTIHGNVTVLSWENETLSHLRVRLVLERTGYSLATAELSRDGSGSKFIGEVSTKSMTIGHFDIQFKVERRGYYSLVYIVGRSFINRAPHYVIPTNIAIFAFFLSTILLTGISIALAYRYYWMIPEGGVTSSDLEEV